MSRPTCAQKQTPPHSSRASNAQRTAGRSGWSLQSRTDRVGQVSKLADAQPIVLRCQSFRGVVEMDRLVLQMLQHEIELAPHRPQTLLVGGRPGGAAAVEAEMKLQMPVGSPGT